MRGFTLLELVVAMAVVATLATLAVPGYRTYLIGVQRTEAITELLGIAACQERVFATGGRFDTTRCLPDNTARYAFRIEPSATTDTLEFTAWADPTGAQRSDPCGSLGLDQAGVRFANGVGVEIDRCWNGR